jgi:hypothetical protein
MAANTQVIRMLQKQRANLESKVAHAEQSIAGWKGEMDSLDGAISALGGKGRTEGRTGAKGRKRGTWRPGHPGRPPKWYIRQQKTKGTKSATKPAKRATKSRRKRKASPKQLAAMAKAREALAAKRAAAK